jgi:hypothetical protein
MVSAQESDATGNLPFWYGGKRSFVGAATSPADLSSLKAGF